MDLEFALNDGSFSLLFMLLLLLALLGSIMLQLLKLVELAVSVFKLELANNNQPY